MAREIRNRLIRPEFCLNASLQFSHGDIALRSFEKSSRARPPRVELISLLTEKRCPRGNLVKIKIASRPVRNLSQAIDRHRRERQAR